MPTVYRVEFSDEAEADQKRMDASLAGVVTFDGRKNGKLMPGHFQALLVGNEIKPLPHPLEMSRLRAENETHLSASLKGILLQVERRICLQCGSVFDAPRVVFSGTSGCLPALLACLLTFAFLRFARGAATDLSLVVSFVALMAVVLLFEWGGALYVRARFSERQSVSNN